MNKRQRKKLYLKKTGKNPPSRLALRGENYNKAVGLANKTRRPYFKPVIIFAPITPEANAICGREAKIQNVITRLMNLLNRALELKSYKTNTEHVVNLAKILSRKRKAKRK